MAIPKRNSKPLHIVGHRTFFVTSASAGHRAILQSERLASLLVDVLLHYQQARKYELHAFVVMPDHFHALLTVGPELSIERAVQFIKGGFSFRASHELGYRGEVWQKGFSEVSINSLERFYSAQNYIHQNPVRRGLCGAPQEFPYSSASGGFPMAGVPRRLKPHDVAEQYGTPKGVP
jgi:putative transposase